MEYHYVSLTLYLESRKQVVVPTQTNANTLALALMSSILWHGDKPCSECGGTMHSQYEKNARAYVCAGCYNEFAYQKGWEK